jgi:hypothetical protein
MPKSLIEELPQIAAEERKNAKIVFKYLVK